MPAISSATSPSLDATPDLPVAFGFKVNWFAVRTQEPERVVEALALGGGVTANWVSGIEAACGQSIGNEAPRVFVSPSVEGWVFVVSGSLPFPNGAGNASDGKREPFYELLGRFAQSFDDVQFFGSHRVVGLVAWARASRGRVTRVFAFADGTVYANAGEQSPEERQLEFADLAGLTPAEATDRMFAIARQHDEAVDELAASNGSPAAAADPMRRMGSRHPIPDESDVVALASRWSVDPSQFPLSGSSTGAGVVIDLPDRFSLR